MKPEKMQEPPGRLPLPGCGCVIMASGMSRRFGKNKLMENFRGRPLISWILDGTEGLFEKRVVVTRHPEIAALCAGRDLEVILHNLPHRSDTVRLGMEALGEMEHCMFCQSDQPLLKRETIEALLLCGADKKEMIWRPGIGQVCASPVLFPKWAFAELRALPEGKGGGWVIRQYPEKVAIFPVEDSWELMDADTPEVFKILENH